MVLCAVCGVMFNDVVIWVVVSLPLLDIKISNIVTLSIDAVDNTTFITIGKSCDVM
jgi:hypothetical protein